MTCSDLTGQDDNFYSRNESETPFIAFERVLAERVLSFITYFCSDTHFNKQILYGTLKAEMCNIIIPQHSATFRRVAWL
jgi:hypothetical protein